MVRLKEAVRNDAHLAALRFNSKMVRLKAYNPANPADTTYLFQFQNGAIKRLFVY